MDALKNDVIKKAADFYEDYYNGYEKNNSTPFVDLGMAYIDFAVKYPHLFRLLFLSGHADQAGMYDLINGKSGNVAKEVARSAAQGDRDPDHIFRQMWFFIHGSGCMAVTGDYELSHEDSIASLEAAYSSFTGK
jgi:hypothetical protein